MKIIEMKKLLIKIFYTIHSKNGGFAFPLDFDWEYRDDIGKYLNIHIYFLCFVIDIIYDFYGLEKEGENNEKL